MGREEIGSRTKRVSTLVCYVTYISTAASIVWVFKNPPSNDWYLNGFVADMVGATVIFLFSLTYGNSSLIDPSWYLFPVSQAIFWVMAAEEVTIRGWMVFWLVMLWALRFLYQWPWEGATEGLTMEDWRFVDWSNYLGVNNHVLYWVFSFLGFHIFPTQMTFFALSPVQKVFMATEDSPRFGNTMD